MDKDERWMNEISESLKTLNKRSGETQIIVAEVRTEVKSVNTRLDDYMDRNDREVQDVKEDVGVLKQDTKEAFGIVHKRVDWVHKVLWGTSAALIILLLSALAYFVQDFMSNKEVPHAEKHTSGSLFPEGEEEKGRGECSGDLPESNEAIAKNGA